MKRRETINVFSTRIMVSSLLLSAVGFAGSCSSKTAEVATSPIAIRRVIKVCTHKSELTRADLKAMAERYGVFKDGQPSIADILRVNKKCLKKPDAEELDLTKADCLSTDKEKCDAGQVFIPIR